MSLHIYSNIFPIFVHNLGSLVDGTKSCMSKHMVSLSLGLFLSQTHTPMHAYMHTYTHRDTWAHKYTYAQTINVFMHHQHECNKLFLQYVHLKDIIVSSLINNLKPSINLYNIPVSFLSN